MKTQLGKRNHFLLSSIQSFMLQTTLDHSPSHYLVYFPKPSYLGSKYHLANWICDQIPSGVNSVFDAFSGSCAIAFECKKRNYQVFTNDFLKFNSMIGKTLIENANTRLSRLEAIQLFQTNPSHYSLIQRLFTNIFFSEEDAKLLDQFRWNVNQLSNEYTRSEALTIMCRVLLRKVALNHFANLKTLEYNKNPERIKKNPSLIKPIQTIFMELLDEYNSAIFDNYKSNYAYHDNILTILPSIHTDCIYLDPPYYPAHANYQDFYHMLETYIEYWEDKQFINQTKQYSPQRISLFDKKNTILKAFELLFEKAQHIPIWLLSSNSKCFPTQDQLIELIKPYRKITIKEKIYKENYGGKGSNKGTKELLFICS